MTEKTVSPVIFGPQAAGRVAGRVYNSAVRWAVMLAFFLLPPQTVCAQRTAAESLAADLDRALSLGRIADARRAAGALAKTPAAHADLLLRSGIRLAENELYAEAEEVFRRCIRERPGLFEAHYNLALAQLAQGSAAGARETLEKIPRETVAQSLAVEYLTGKTLEALGNPKEAERHLSAAFAGAPERENYGLDLGLLYLRERDYRRAIVTLDRAAALHPVSPFLRVLLALAQILGGRRADGINNARKALASDAQFGAARLLIAAGLYMDGEYANAAAAAAEALVQPNPHPYLHYLRAASLLKLNSQEYRSMLKDLNTAIGRIPTCGVCYLERSKVHQALGDDRAAAEDLQVLVRQFDPDFAQAWYRLAALYDRAGRKAEAAEARARFRAIKAQEADRETEALRNQFVGPAANP